MKRAVFIGWSSDDILGASESTRANPSPVLVDIDVLSRYGQLATIRGPGFVAHDIPYGSQPGNWRVLGGITDGDLQQLKQTIVTLSSDSNAKIAALAQAVIALYRIINDDGQ